MKMQGLLLKKQGKNAIKGKEKLKSQIISIPFTIELCVMEF